MKPTYENDDQKWSDLHSQLQDMLAGYVDDELDNDQKLLVEAHLSGCQQCRNDMARQQVIARRLEVMPPPRLSTESHRHIDQLLSSESISIKQVKQSIKARFVSFITKVNRLSLRNTINASGWGIAFVLAVVILMPTLPAEKTVKIPMITDAISEYRGLEDKALPTSMNQSKKPPVNWPNAHLLATWQSTIAGEPAQVYALRSGRNIVFQYHINESVLFRNPVVRKAIAESGNYKVRANKLDVIAMPLTDAGILIVGPTDSLPAPEKVQIESI